MSGLSQALQLCAEGAGFAAVVAYFVVLARRPEWVRVLNGSGLLFVGVALFQTPFLMQQAKGAGVVNVDIIVVLLILAAIAQGFAALRNRRAWDGRERRRASDVATAEGRAA